MPCTSNICPNAVGPNEVSPSLAGSGLTGGGGSPLSVSLGPGLKAQSGSVTIKYLSPLTIDGNGNLTVGSNVFIEANGSVPFAGNQSMGGFRLTSLGAPMAGSDAVSRSWVQGYVSSISTTASGPANGPVISGTYPDGLTIQPGAVQDSMLADCYIRCDGSQCPSANISWCDHRLTDLADPINPMDAVNLETMTAYVASHSGGGGGNGIATGFWTFPMMMGG